MNLKGESLTRGVLRRGPLIAPEKNGAGVTRCLTQPSIFRVQDQSLPMPQSTAQMLQAQSSVSLAQWCREMESRSLILGIFLAILPSSDQSLLSLQTHQRSQALQYIDSPKMSVSL